jgi:sugar lactone lactonase YvrE
MSSAPECVWALETELGEGPIWSAAENAVWFVDIKQKKIHRFDPATGTGRSVPAPDQPGFIAPLASGGFIVGLKTGLHSFDPASGAFTPRHAVEPQKPENRLNDGAVDPEGRLWFGSMHDGETDSTGSLYRLDASGPCAADTDYVITNGPAFSPDCRTLYHTDTLKRVTFAFDMAKNGTLSNKRVFVQYSETDGYPDGPTVDSEGCVWTAFFAGWAARRYSPKGALIATVRFPCANITKIAFGGVDLRDVYATTAWKGMDARTRAEQPLAGGLFRFRADVPGLPQNEIRHG